MLILKLGVFRFENSKPRILKFMVFDRLKIPKSNRQSSLRNFLNFAFDPENKRKSGNNEPNPLFLLGSEGTTVEQDEIKIVPIKTGNTQNELPYNEFPENHFLRYEK